MDELARRAPLPEGYRYELLRRERIAQLASALSAWYPGIAVGNASCFLKPEFYSTKVSLAGEERRDVIAVLFMRDDEPAGLFSGELDRDSAVLYGRIGVIAPAHRGARLSRNLLLVEEAIGRAMGLGMVYGLATLRYPQMQATFERLGWNLIGIIPGFDQEMVAPGVVKRVYEAVYAKVLVGEDELLRPHAKDVTPAVRTLLDLLYPGVLSNGCGRATEP